jgi:hypothetical protein
MNRIHRRVVSALLLGCLMLTSACIGTSDPTVEYVSEVRAFFVAYDEASAIDSDILWRQGRDPGDPATWAAAHHKRDVVLSAPDFATEAPDAQAASSWRLWYRYQIELIEDRVPLEMRGTHGLEAHQIRLGLEERLDHLMMENR